MSLVTTDNPPEFFISEAPVHTLSVLVNNKAGVLMRICQVFARRGYNIDSLVVSQGRDKQFSRMTIGISGDPAGLEQIILQVTKLVDVIHCVEHDSDHSVVKELLLVKFLVDKEDRTEALQIIDHYDGKTVDLTPTSMIAMINGESSKIDASLAMFSQFEIIETVRTGKVVMARSEKPT
ncbi:acetolactate synthase small subunit [Verrucomicrobiaceae bacterium R5-34]|uniref:Acetolactate synthase small subunit n=1 Tax=Oceaniferula flava TaxID=2800421 RepID=A0AAE2VDD8_9BACT|nr:acetolactate synthase small subunit [Oceaniferula flavus]MBK1830713.1 acetolactate synthase small subunit [Verrucomicrobiaceae bacterium R5-34]MBK1855971.1 acetolactate synthase small subunit [Oceaniferula flavus]MBM1137278.1 acetolactate synthase small subunit [Oceaniferula flavus]